MDNVELVRMNLSSLRPRPDYRVDEVRKAGRGYILEGTKNNPPATITAYLDDSVYVEEAKYPKAIRYKMRMGDTVTEQIFSATIDFEGMWLGHYKKQADVTVYFGMDVRSLDIPLDADVNMVVRKFFAEEFSKRPDYLTNGLSVPYKRMLDFLEKRLEYSMKWLNSKEANLEEPSKKR